MESVTTGKPAAETTLGMPVFEYLAKNPDYSKVFNDAMTTLSAPVIAAALEAYDFSQIGTLVDVAGGHGEVLMSILKKHPNVRGVLTDVGHVIDGAKPRIAGAGLADRCQAVPCDFFQAVPEGGDAYIMKHIIHDWDDARATTILRNIGKAMGDQARQGDPARVGDRRRRRAGPRQVHRHRDAADAGRPRAERRRVPRACLPGPVSS